MTIPSLIKWTGSKRAQAQRITTLAPPHRRYLEPFLGGGAVLYLLAHPGAIATDLYAPLIELWRLARDAPGVLVADYRRQWQALREDLPGYYYQVRARFNASPNPLDLNLLLRTCVNGIVRFNRAGHFNNSLHLSRPGMHPDRFAAIVSAWHARLRGVDLLCRDFADTLADARHGDFVYLDPPYHGNRQRYFAGVALDHLLAVLDDLNARDVRWALSFDGGRGTRDLSAPLPSGLYRRRLVLAGGHSAVGKVLNGPVEPVYESLYLNY